MSIRLGNTVRLHIGDTGCTLTAMRPQGKIAISGRIHDARSDGFWIDPGVNVVVINGDHLGVIVRQLDAECSYEVGERGRVTPLAAWQQPVGRSREPQSACGNDWKRFLLGLRESACLGAVYGIICVAFGFAETEISDWLAIRSVVACFCGALWGGLLFLFINALLQDLGEFEQLTLVTLGLALIGSTGGTVAGYSIWGLLGGFAGAVLGAFALGMVLPILIVALIGLGGAADGDA